LSFVIIERNVISVFGTLCFDAYSSNAESADLSTGSVPASQVASATVPLLSWLHRQSEIGCSFGALACQPFRAF